MEPNLPPFSILSTDLGHLILKLLNIDIIFYFMFISHIYSAVGGGGQIGHFMALGRAMVPPGSACDFVSVSLAAFGSPSRQSAGYVCHVEFSLSS